MCALRRENALAQSSPLYRSQGHVSRRSAQAESRNGGEHAWSFVRIGRVFDIFRTKRRCWGCISAANRPLTDEPGGQRTPRRARGFPMWTFLAINPPAGRNSPYRLVGVQGFGEKRAFQRMTGRFCLVGVRAQFKNGYGYWAQLPTRLPGEHSGWGKLAERVGLPCPIA